MINGPVFPVVVGFDKYYNVDYHSIEEYIKYILNCGGHNIMVASATGRFAHLTDDEIDRVNFVTIETTLDNGGTPIASTPINGCTKSHIETARKSEVNGAKIIICEYPWRYQGSDALIGYFKDICESTDMSVMLHVTPSRSEIDTSFGDTHRYELDDLEAICELPNVIGFKEACGDKDHAEKIWHALANKTDIIVAGRASETFINARIHRNYNVSGFFTGVGSIYPSHALSVYKSVLELDGLAAGSEVEQASSLLNTCKHYGWHSSLKYCLHKLHLMPLYERPPMCPISKVGMDCINKELSGVLV
jgi:dihydrodipicolinate synthase/N-acetylneuraminate lyase